MSKNSTPSISSLVRSAMTLKGMVLWSEGKLQQEVKTLSKHHSESA